MRTRRCRDAVLLVGIIGTCSTYAIIRYVVVGGVAMAHIPLYVLNKALAFSAVLCCCVALVAGRVARRPPTARLFGRAGIALALLHGALSLALLSPAYYGKLFIPDGRLSGAAELSILLGIVVAGIMLWHSWHRRGSCPRPPRLARTALIPLIAGHLFAIGCPGWSAVDGWPAHLPPITLLSFIAVVGTPLVVAVALLPAVQRRRARRRAAAPAADCQG